MKRYCFFSVLFLLVGGVAMQAQLTLGVKAGVNLSQITYSRGQHVSQMYNANIKNMTGYQVGPMLEYTTPKLGFGLDAAVLYSQEGFRTKGFRSDEHEEPIHNTANVLEIPVNLKVKLILLDVVNAYAAAGPYASFKLSDNLQAQYYDKSFGAGMNLGVGIELLLHWQLGVNYKLALTDNYADLDLNDRENIRAKQRTWTISAAYLF